jgi:hypothetical protein
MGTFLIIIAVIAFVIFLIAKNQQSTNKPDKTDYYTAANSTTQNNRFVVDKKSKVDAYHSTIGFTVDMEIQSSQNFEIKGTFIDSRKNICLNTTQNEELKIVPEPTNENDKNALKLCNFNNDVLGYIPASSAGRISRLLKTGVVFRAFYDGNTDGKYFRARVNVTEYKKPG